MLRDRQVPIPADKRTNLIFAGVAEDFDKGIHLLVITELYKEFGDVLGRPNTVALTEENHVVDVGSVEEDGAETQAALTHLATANHEVAAFTVSLHMDFGDAAVVKLAGFESPVSPFHGGFILLDVEGIGVDSEEPEDRTDNIHENICRNIINGTLSSKI